MPEPHTHLEVWHVDGTILQECDEDAAPFPLNIGEQMIVGNNTYQVREVIDTDPTELDGRLHYRRIIRVG
jgi:hypothetical protein